MPRRIHPNYYIIAGSNGAGKTTFATEFLPSYAHCSNFINPDLIAGGLSPFDPAAAMTRAGRLVLEQIHRNVRARTDFAFETTLSGRSYAPLLKKMRAADYRLHMFYLWIPDPDLALGRIHERVRGGGHDVPAIDVRRRFHRSLRNLFTLYRASMDLLQVFDNSLEAPRLIFMQERGKTTVYDNSLYQKICAEVNR
jgi:predicted ABC-type ATPase